MPADRVKTCSECGTTFAWTAEEQVGDEEPALCPACRILAPKPGRQRGIVKWYHRTKGYGFITPASGSEVFVHKSGLAPGQGSLRQGQLVEFNIARSRRGPQAASVIALVAETAEA